MLLTVLRVLITISTFLRFTSLMSNNTSLSRDMWKMHPESKIHSYLEFCRLTVNAMGLTGSVTRLDELTTFFVFLSGHFLFQCPSFPQMKQPPLVALLLNLGLDLDLPFHCLPFPLSNLFSDLPLKSTYRALPWPLDLFIMPFSLNFVSLAYVLLVTSLKVSVSMTLSYFNV